MRKKDAERGLAQALGARNPKETQSSLASGCCFAANEPTGRP